MDHILTALLVVGLVLLAWITQRGKMDFEAEDEKRRDERKADFLIAQVREELAAKKRTDEERAR